MKRRNFVAASAAAVACAPLLGAVSGQPPSLRVLLGEGSPRPVPSGGFEFGGRRYRGSFSRAPDGRVINLVALEEYLYSVVPREMPSSWPVAALQIQAICARTFVLRHAHPQRPFDVVPSDLDQVYEGTATESPAGRQAVDATTGTILRYGNVYADIAYSSCCGGHTESASDAWGGAPLPYLAGVVCPYCMASPDYRWSRDIAFAAIARATARQLSGMGQLRDVRLGTRDASGRARYIELITNRATAAVQGSDFRLTVGPRVVPSLLILTLSVQAAEGALTGPLLHLEGAGNGHGVGLCQWGARGMALRNATAATIAGFYFPSTTLDTWTNVSPPATSTTSLRH
ncbi:MAG: SpoIID/LytB domain-containing protein [Candidatus Tyrphobacter sp.]